MIWHFWCIAQEKWSLRQISWLITWLNEDKTVFLEQQRKRRIFQTLIRCPCQMYKVHRTRLSWLCTNRQHIGPFWLVLPLIIVNLFYFDYFLFKIILINWNVKKSCEESSRWISQYIFAPNGGYCLFFFSKPASGQNSRILQSDWFQERARFSNILPTVVAHGQNIKWLCCQACAAQAKTF